MYRPWRVTLSSNCCYTKFQLLRFQLTADRLNYTPCPGEPVWDEQECQLYVGDGTTPGGKPVGGAETLTILQRIGNILRYTDEDGVDTDIDLSDLVNDARIVSASLNPTTGIVTFTRNDASTLPLDLSALLDQDADEVPFTPCAPLVSTNVQDAICELLSQVQNGDFETLTTLQKIGNILRYTDEDGVQTDIDLSIYLDDTNLARLVSGTLNPTTGILTVTRDDSSTFTIDLSALLDNQNANEVPFTPCGTLTSTNVQDAICELEANGGSGGPTGPLCAIQLRMDVDLFGNGSFQKVDWDNIIVENDTSVLERDDTNISRVLIKETGLYQVTYSVTHDIETDDFQDFKVTKNGTTDLPQSLHTHRQNGSVDSDYYIMHNTFAVELTAGDYLELEWQGNNTSHLENCRTHFSVICLKGSKGDKGDTGSGSNIVVQKDDVTVGTVTDVLNFEGDVTVVDNGSNKTTVTVTGGGVSVFGSEFHEAEDDSQSSTTEDDYYVQKLELLTSSVPAGKYRIGWSYEIRGSSTGDSVWHRVQYDNSNTIAEGEYEPKDTSNWLMQSGFKYLDLGSGTHEFDIDFRTTDDDEPVYIRRARLEFWRIS